MSVAAALSSAPAQWAHAQDINAAQGSQPALRGTFASETPQPNAAAPSAAETDDDDAAPEVQPAVPQDDGTTVAPDQDNLEPSLKPSEPDDGDLNFPAEPAPAIDGDVTAAEKPEAQDSTDSSSGGRSDGYDVGIFDNPPAGYDPLLFQIEDLDRYADNRTTGRLFRQEPYDPVGIKVGSFVLFPELELGTSYYSNDFHEQGSPSDWSFDVKPSARLVSNWATNALELRAAGVLSYYNEFQTEDD
ncbi:MAG: outer membrane beta-barrel protein, partial [Hyphomicrobium sp.]